MGFSDYHFVTHWRIQGPIDKIYEILKAGENYSRWWKSCYLESQKIDSRRVNMLVRARMPYTLRFTAELSYENSPHEFEIRAMGEVEGRGCWKLKSEGEFTRIEFYWDVRAKKPWMYWLSPLLKPIFQWNHAWVMKKGEKALQNEIFESLTLRMRRPLNSK